MKLKGKYSESAVLYAIILSVAGVLAVAVFFIVLYLQGNGKAPASTDRPAETTTAAASETKATEKNGFDADRELTTEMFDAAGNLILDNYTVLKLYYTKGLKHKDEPYGNAPEDGYYTVDSDDYTSLDQLEAIVDRTYTAEFAETVKTNPLGYGAVYKTRDNGTLGIIENYTPMPYTYSWDNPDFEIRPKSETECDIKITIHDKTDDSEVKLDASMTKTDGGWRLVSVIF